MQEVPGEMPETLYGDHESGFFPRV
jgi:hypothetical protein